MADFSSSRYEPQELGKQTLELTISLLKQVVTILETHVELVPKEQAVAHQLNERVMALMGAEGETDAIDYELESRNQQTPQQK